MLPMEMDLKRRRSDVFLIGGDAVVRGHRGCPPKGRHGDGSSDRRGIMLAGVPQGCGTRCGADKGGGT